jgi:5-hydroxyisourate hydrolase-like protein (transthyretin family)
LAPAQDDRCAIEGQVLNGATGEPLKKAAVRLDRLDSRSRAGPTGTLTDADGKFAILESDIDP